ncbi:DUF11 domain-containing protein [Erythrobacter litoralis]|uniref:proprotein convertase P-domain-containing protein n=1 Tax=Erythrobacter litoralis TaxID=39960 RepID=UPI002435900F|nr:proprotein convertase P-domain-containing protein [Erythrobacter litoralis]MDG6079704.1 DUF11 domain-containing protein [Erythrobacter litoralis]
MKWRKTLVSKAAALFGLCAALGAHPAMAQTSTTFSNTTVGNLNATTPCATPLVRTFSVSGVNTVSDVNIGVLATHSWRGDLQFTLVSPLGTRVQLTIGDATNISGDNFNVLFDDAATQVVNTDGATRNHATTAPPYQNTYRPRNALSAFNGQNGNGTWRLEVCDLFPTEDDGSFRRADLYLTSSRSAGIAPMLQCPNQSILFDWDAIAWTSGSTVNSYPLGSLGNIGFNLTNNGAWLNNATFGGQSPARQNSFTGGIPNAGFSLGQVADQPNQSGRATTTISLPQIMRGAQFAIFDVDSNPGQFADLVVVEGRLRGAVVQPVLTNGISNYVIGNAAYGDGASDNDQANGNVVVTFNQPIDTIVIAYGNHSAAPVDPGQQGIAIHDITFCRPTTTVTIAKTSRLLNGQAGSFNVDFHIPGSRIEYCLRANNTGDSSASQIRMSDFVPSTVSYVPGSIRSGQTCTTAATVEDDNGDGADETDPAGAQFLNGEIRASQTTLNAGQSAAFTFQVIVK